MNVSSVEQDIRDFNNPDSGFHRGPVFTLQSAPWMRALDNERGISSLGPINTNEQMSEHQERLLNDLSSIDKRYREILTAAASLTSSMRALRVATASLAVAALVFLFSDNAQKVLSGLLKIMSALARHLLHI
jgi:hypothetical protein